MEYKMKIGFIVGSLRKESWNRKVAEVAKGLFPAGFDVDFIEIADLPLYNQELEDGNLPPSYGRLREAVRQHDGFIFFTPEYNRSYAPAIKNAMDVASRDPDGNPWAGKPAAVFSASPGGFGGMAGNHALRQVFVCLGIIPLQQPEVYIPKISSCFDGDMMNDKTLALLRKAVDAFAVLVRKLR